MRYIVLFFLVSLTVNAQRVKQVVGMSKSIAFDFYTSGFYNMGLGFEFRAFRFLKPEVKIDYILGVYDEREKFDENGNVVSRFNRTVTAVNFGFSPKIILFEDEDENYYFQLMPQCNMAKIEAVGSYIERNKDNPTLSNTEKQRIKETQLYFGIGMGIVLYLSSKHQDAVALNLYYQGINLGNTLSSLNHSQATINTRDVFSFGVVYYISFK